VASAETPSPHPPHARARRSSGEALDDGFELDPAFIEDVAAALRADDRDQARTLVEDLHYADMADLFERLDSEDRRLLIEAIREDFQADVLPELDAEVRYEVMDALGFEDFAVALTELDSDDAVYVAGKLDAEELAKTLERLSPEKRELIEQGLGYGENSAGRLMQRELVAVPYYWTVGETIDYLRSTRNVPDKFYAVFVVDSRHRPQGVVELHRVLTSKRPIRMQDLISPDIDIIPTDMDREEVAFLFRQRDLTSAPVVDKSGRLIGQITIDDIVDVIDEEASAAILKMAGVSEVDQSSLYTAVIATAQSRFTWLALNLITAFIASSVVGMFTGSIEKLAALAVLMPIVAGMGGNAGTQTLATVVRALATREIDSSNALRVVGKELFVGMINGLLFAALVGAVATVWFSDIMLGLVIAAAMMTNLTVAGLAGILIPLSLDKAGIDPAPSAGVLLTTVTDIVGFFTFLGLATWILL
jgi:magnesium transporter